MSNFAWLHPNDARKIIAKIDQFREGAADGEVDDVQWLAEIAWALTERLANFEITETDGANLIRAIERGEK